VEERSTEVVIGKECVEGCGWRGRLVVAKEAGALVWIPSAEGHAEGAVDFADGADALEWFGFGMASELVEVEAHVRVVKHAFAENGVEPLRGYEWGKNNVGE